MEKCLQNRVALITGGNGGTGLGIANRFLDEGALMRMKASKSATPLDVFQDILVQTLLRDT